MIALIRIAIVVFNIVVYFTLAPVEIRPELARAIVFLAPIYAAITFLLAARTDQHAERGEMKRILHISLISTVGDLLLIALWIYATGGPDSPFYLLYHASVAASVGRFGVIIGAVTTIASALAYVTVVLIDGGAPVYPILVRVGYMFFIGAFSGYLVEVMRRSERAVAAADASARSYREINDLKSAFVQNVSHELRTPLTVIRGASSTLRRKHTALDDDQRSALLEMIEKHSAHFGRLIQDLLDFATTNRGEMDLALSDVELSELVRAEIEIVQPNITQRIHLEEEEPVQVRCDRPKIGRALHGLLDNAAKFSPPGGDIYVRISNRVGMAIVAVTDKGKGIEGHLQEKVFESFFQIDPPPQGGAEGTGIGLHVAREIVRLHGGELSVESAPGSGSTFSIHLPVKTDDEATGSLSA